MKVASKDIYKAYQKCHKGKKGTLKAQVYSAKLLDNILATTIQLNTNTYKAKAYSTFIAKNGSKPREIFAANFKDRVVHHFIVPHLEKLISHKFHT